MSKIAIDIVLLPPQHIIDLCIPLNSSSDLSNYVDFREGYIPHVTLSMVCVDENDLPKIKSAVEDILHSYSPFELTIDKIEFWENIFGLNIVMTPELRKLYEEVTDILKPYRLGKADPSMFTEPERVNPLKLTYIEEFVEKHSGDNYIPHITIGKEKYDNEPQLPVRFTADTLAIFQLGPFYTCKKQLEKMEI